jgi:hypothetical protein
MDIKSKMPLQLSNFYYQCWLTIQRKESMLVVVCNPSGFGVEKIICIALENVNTIYISIALEIQIIEC